MTLWQPTRRAFVTGASLALTAAASARAAPLLGPQPLSFMVVGDWGRGNRDQKRVAEAMFAVWEKQHSRFVVSTGDNFYWLGVDSVTDRKWTDRFVKMYRAELGPWHAVLGNHDYGGNVRAQIDRTGHPDGRWHMPSRCFAHPVRQAGLPNLDLFFIDTVAWTGKEGFPFNLLGSAIGRAAQRAQLQQLSDLLEASTAPVKLVFGHFGIYSIGKHGGAMRMKELDDLLRAHRVAAYVNGHDHCLYHISHAGMHYVCSGAGSEVLAGYKGGGPSRYPPGCVVAPFCSDENDARATFPKWHRFLARSPHPNTSLEGGFALFTLTAQDLSFAFYDGRQKLRHSAMLARFNQVGAM